MPVWLIRHQHVEVSDEGPTVLIRSLGFGAGRLEHTNRNVVFIPAPWVDAGLPEEMEIVYQEDEMTRFSGEYRRRVRARLSDSDPGHLMARLGALIGDASTEPRRPASPLPMRVTDEGDGAPVARLGIPDSNGMAELTVCGPSLEVALARGTEARLAKDALAFALPVLTDALRLVELVRAGRDPAAAYDPELPRQIDYIDSSGARIALLG